jgi:aminopeptidase N
MHLRASLVRRPRFAAPLVALALAGVLAACGPSREMPPPAEPAWDSVSPPPIPAWLPLESPDPIEFGRPPAPGEYDLPLEVTHYDVEIVVPPANDRISGRTVIHYLRDEGGPHRLDLDITGLRVEAVREGVGGRHVPFEQSAGRLSVDVTGSFNRYDTIRVEVLTRGSPTDGLIMRDNVHGEATAFADNWPNRARFWFPAIDHPSQKATVAFTVHAPEGKRVVANGVQLGEPTPADPARTGAVGGLRTWRWATSVRIPTYLMVIGVADMVVMDGGEGACGRAPASVRPDGCVPVTAWAFPPDTAHARHVFRRSAQMLDLYSETFGPYPYEKLANVQASTRFGGMENASAIFYSEQAIASGRDIEGTVAHEIVHQWFGNSVTPADWPHLWLSEGFASYFGPWFWEITDGAGEFRRRLDGVRDRYFASTEVHDRPIVDEGAENLMDLLNRNSYQKGALVLHMLRWVMGERAFFQGIRRYYSQHAGGSVVTSDFRLAMEQAYGDSLGWFFDQWLHQPGFPIYRAEWEWDGAARQVVLTIRQEQSGDWPTFRMPIEVEFALDGGVWRDVIMVDGREFTRRLDVRMPPQELRLDPDGWILMQRVGEVAGGG